MLMFIPYLIFLNLQITLMTSFRHTKKTSYSPYGPEMCKQLCNGFKDSFIYLKKYLACYHTPNDTLIHMTNLSSGDFFACFKEDNTITYLKRDLSLANEHETCANNEQGSPRPFPRSIADTKSTKKVQVVQHNSTSEMHQACKDGNLCKVKYILSTGRTHLNCRDRSGRTPAMTAVENGQHVVFSFLFSQGCDLTAVDDDGNTVLHVACSAGYVNILRKIVRSGKCNIEAKSKYGMTPLIQGVHCGHIQVYKFLESRGANIRACHGSGYNILHTASVRGHVDIAKYILKTGVIDIESKTNDEKTPLLLAAYSGKINILEFLVSKGSDLQAVDNTGYNILHLACMGGHLNAIKYVLSLQAVVIDSIDYRGKTAVLTAAGQGKLEVVKCLNENKCNMAVSDGRGNNLLHIACKRGFFNIVKYLIQLKGTRWNDKNMNRRTPLQEAMYAGNSKIVAYLRRTKTF